MSNFIDFNLNIYINKNYSVMGIPCFKYLYNIGTQN